MSKALRARLDSSFSVDSSDLDKFASGSLYLVMIETEEAVLVASEFRDQANLFEVEDKPMIFGSFWEAELECQWREETKKLFANFGGNFAFELDDPEGLDGVDVDDGEVNSIAVAWAIDGDSPKTVVDISDVNAELSDTDEDDEFEEL